MDSLYLLQFACLIFMLVNAFIVAVSHLHVRWESRRYEHSRWMIVAAMIGLAMQYAVQMVFGFRAMHDNLGAVVNILIYTPCFSLISMGIYNIETTRANLRKMIQMCSGIYAAILLVFCVEISLHHSLYIREGLYLMLALFCLSVIYCIFMIIREMIRRKKLLETMVATDMLPYVRYSRASVIILWLAVLALPVAIFSTTLLYIVGPVVLFALLFFNLTFISSRQQLYPNRRTVGQRRGNQRIGENRTPETIWGASLNKDKSCRTGTETLQQLSEERIDFIRQRLDEWCADLGYKDCAVNMLTLSRTLSISKEELSIFFDQCMQSTFRIWLSEIRFNAAKKMMLDYPDYSNDIISAECGFSARTYLYRVFKTKEGCTPAEWREEQAATRTLS